MMEAKSTIRPRLKSALKNSMCVNSTYSEPKLIERNSPPQEPNNGDKENGTDDPYNYYTGANNLMI